MTLQERRNLKSITYRLDALQTELDDLIGDVDCDNNSELEQVRIDLSNCCATIYRAAQY